MTTLAVSWWWSSPFLRRASVEAVLAGAVGGCIGVHVLLRRLAFFASAMTHGTVPGLVLAAMVGAPLMAGSLVFGTAFALAVFALTGIGAAHRSTVIGVLLSGSLALGLALQSFQRRPDVKFSALLTGSILTTTPAEVRATLVLALAVAAVLMAMHKELVLGAFDPGASAALGYGRGPELTLLLVLTASVTMGVQAVGAVLSVALLTVPALAARSCTERVERLLPLAAAIGGGSGLAGLLVSANFDIAAGAAIALATVAALALAAVAGVHGVVRQRWRSRHAVVSGAASAAGVATGAGAA